MKYDPSKIKPIDNAEDWAKEIARIASGSNCEDLLVLDLRGISEVTDFFVIATGTSDRQVCSVADELEFTGKHNGNKLSRMAGHDSGDWIVMDFFDVVVHLFTPDMRGYYDLELIWGECPKLDWQK